MRAQGLSAGFVPGWESGTKSILFNPKVHAIALKVASTMGGRLVSMKGRSEAVSMTA